MSTITIIDYGVGNILSVQRAFEHAGATVAIATTPEEIHASEKLVLPGVGAFKQAMDKLHKLALVEPILAAARQGKPLMAICLGMQMLLSHSDEFGGTAGLDIIPGNVSKIPHLSSSQERKIPHIGWNEITNPHLQSSWENTPLRHSHDGDAYYFVHSFNAMPEDPAHLLAVSEYSGFQVTAAISKGNIFGFQFHPEKSGEIGLDIIKAFLSI